MIIISRYAKLHRDGKVVQVKRDEEASFHALINKQDPSTGILASSHVSRRILAAVFCKRDTETVQTLPLAVVKFGTHDALQVDDVAPTNYTQYILLLISYFSHVLLCLMSLEKIYGKRRLYCT